MVLWLRRLHAGASLARLNLFYERSCWWNCSHQRAKRGRRAAFNHMLLNSHPGILSPDCAAEFLCCFWAKPFILFIYLFIYLIFYLLKAAEPRLVGFKPNHPSVFDFHIRRLISLNPKKQQVSHETVRGLMYKRYSVNVRLHFRTDGYSLHLTKEDMMLVIYQNQTQIRSETQILTFKWRRWRVFCSVTTNNVISYHVIDLAFKKKTLWKRNNT